MDEDDVDSEGKDPEKSPNEKKKGKDKRGWQKDEASSILKTGRFTAAALVGKKLNLGEVMKTVTEKRKDEYNNHEYKYSRVVLVCSLKCSQDGVEAKMNEFLMGICALFKHMLKIDKSVLVEPEKEGGPRLFVPQGLPMVFTDCVAWIKVSGNAGVFEMWKPRKNDNDDGNRGGKGCR